MHPLARRLEMDRRDYGRDVNEQNHSSGITESNKKEKKT